MRKIFAMILAVMLVASMAVTAHAATPKLKVPDMPEISNIKIEVKLDETTEKAIENHAAEWVKKMDFSKIDYSNLPKLSSAGG